MDGYITAEIMYTWPDQNSLIIRSDGLAFVPYNRSKFRYNTLIRLL